MVEQSTLDKSYFFEIPGKPGKIYIDEFKFGGFHLHVRVDGHSSSSLMRSPVSIYPAGGATFSPLHKILDEYYQKIGGYDYETGNPVSPAGILPECLITVETKHKGKVTVRAKYQLLKIKVAKIFDPSRQGRSGSCYELEFGDSNIIKYNQPRLTK